MLNHDNDTDGGSRLQAGMNAIDRREKIEEQAFEKAEEER